LVSEAVVSGVKKRFPGKDIHFKLIPLTDGGDGFLDVLTLHLHLELLSTTVTGPLGEQIEANCGISTAPQFRGVGVIEMASASGLEKVPKSKRNPMNTTTKGTGELIKFLHGKGCNEIIIGVGGSATNDAGLGCGQALGLGVKLEDGTFADPVYGRHLPLIRSLHYPSLPLLPHCSIKVACDVDNPFVGERGATYMFSGQKGATEEMKETLEKAMRKVADLYQLFPNHPHLHSLPGAGAAGGLGGGLVAFQQAEIIKGIKFVSELVALEENIKESDVVITGEGSYDSQTKHGKVISEVTLLANKHNKPLVIICGKQDQQLPQQHSPQVFDLVSRYGVDKSISQTADCVQQLTYDNCHLFVHPHL